MGAIHTDISRAFDSCRGGLAVSSRWLPQLDATLLLVREVDARGAPARSAAPGVAKLVCGLFGRESFLGERAVHIAERADACADADSALWWEIRGLLQDAREFATMSGQFRCVTEFF